MSAGSGEHVVFRSILIGAGIAGFAAATVTLVGLISVGNSQPFTGNTPSADPARSIAHFEQIATVLRHPRCQNCHTLTDYPRQGDDRRRHQMNVRRGPEGRGLPGMRCITCHGRANNAASGVPGADEDWHLAPLSMGWEGLTTAELCRNLKDPKRNGGRTGKDVLNHLHTQLVEWAWTPGDNAQGSERTSPPLLHADFVNAAEAWITTGAACPAD